MRMEKKTKENTLLAERWVIAILIFFFLCSSSVKATVLRYEGESEKTKGSLGVHHKLSAALPNAQARAHRVGLLQLCVTNWGFFGNGQGDSRYNLKEAKGGCFTPNPNEEVQAPSAEYPAGSGIGYLFWGGLWLGAMVENHPYVSVGCDGWFLVHEMWPDAGEKGAIKERSVRRNVSCYSPDAVSEQDIIAVYTDTSADIPLSPDDKDPWDNRKHFPLGLEITQKSYSWSYEYAEDFVLIDFFIKNIGEENKGHVYGTLHRCGCRAQR
jgi:hypothetical protein